LWLVTGVQTCALPISIFFFWNGSNAFRGELNSQKAQENVAIMDKGTARVPERVSGTAPLLKNNSAGRLLSWKHGIFH